jgi:hypothetical protein
MQRFVYRGLFHAKLRGSFRCSVLTRGGVVGDDGLEGDDKVKVGGAGVEGGDKVKVGGAGVEDGVVERVGLSIGLWALLGLAIERFPSVRVLSALQILLLLLLLLVLSLSPTAFLVLVRIPDLPLMIIGVLPTSPFVRVVLIRLVLRLFALAARVGG